ncbi:helix-turn-helix domain-containing protein [Streptomyces sp. NPDC005805]|uniref:helix-turn-helix domain-containing protein n=1 Tax=Streptomyces sp. NPDC005805 TaxID=3157068 RepID=UPI0033D39256
MTQSTAPSASWSPLPPPKERRRLREAKALTEAQLAAVVGVTKSTLRSWETGRTDPRGRRRETYAKLLAEFAAEAGAGQKQRPAPKPTWEQKPVQEPEAPPATAAAAAPPVVLDKSPEPPEAQESPEAPAPVVAATPPEKAPVEPEPEPGPGPGPGPGPAPDAGSGAPLAPLAPLAPPALTPEEAFDLLYTRVAATLVRETHVLTGRRRLSHEAVERAFQLAWQRWPDVAVDRDPAGWVRAAAYEYAMSPWNRLRPAHRHPDDPPEEPRRRELLSALHQLPPPHRRTLLLYDGLGLDLPDTAAETEATTPATANRVLHAREAVAARLPDLADTELLRRELREVTASGPVPQPTPAEAVRTGCERRAERWTRIVVVATALIAAATVLALLTSPRGYEPPMPPTQQVEGVPPPQNGPERLSKEAKKLRDKLRDAPAAGPARLQPGPG